MNLCHFFDFCHPKNPNEKYTPPYGTARGDPILMEGTVLYSKYYWAKNNWATWFISSGANCFFINFPKIKMVPIANLIVRFLAFDPDPDRVFLFGSQLRSRSRKNDRNHDRAIERLRSSQHWLMFYRNINKLFRILALYKIWVMLIFLFY